MMVENDMLKTLKKYFGYDQFRPYQEEIISTAMAGRDSLVLMPTGGGKSLCYQLPALLRDGLVVVISPLISLMQDQVDGLRGDGIPAEALNSTMDSMQCFAVKQSCMSGKVKLLYMSPERFLGEIEYFLQDVDISLIAVDEAHCISSWGHDFRREYTKLGLIKKAFPGVPVMALTATADKVTKDDIIEQLKLDSPKVFVSSFDRPNLDLSVKRGLKDADKRKYILNYLLDHPGDHGIVYCLSKKNTEKVASFLLNNGINAAPYHAGLGSELRARVQDDFIRDKIDVVCATVAFGMGIDKSNVRFVFHYNMPKSLENFYQEIGRAGRDGLPSDTVLFYSYSDIILLNSFVEESAQKEVEADKLDRMKRYAESDICRRRMLLNYFGENMDRDCGHCDVCRNPPVLIDGTVPVQMALSAIARTNEQVGVNMLVGILRGSAGKELLDRGFDKIKTYGAGRNVPYSHWEDYIFQMINLGYLEVAYNESKHLKITSSGKEVLYGRKEARLCEVEEYKYSKKPAGQRRRAAARQLPSGEANPENLFELLRQLRKKSASEQGVPPYLVMSDKVLREIARVQPQSLEEFGEIGGIGEYKLKRYGKVFVAAVQEYLKR